MLFSLVGCGMGMWEWNGNAPLPPSLPSFFSCREFSSYFILIRLPNRGLGRGGREEGVEEREDLPLPPLVFVMLLCFDSKVPPDIHSGLLCLPLMG